MKAKNTDMVTQNKIFTYLAAATAAILSLPLIAMQFTTEVDWSLGDFLIMGALIFGTGFLFVHVARVTPRKYRTLTGIAFLVALVLTWAHLAVGIIDTAPFAGS